MASVQALFFGVLLFSAQIYGQCQNGAQKAWSFSGYTGTVSGQVVGCSVNWSADGDIQNTNYCNATQGYHLCNSLDGPTALGGNNALTVLTDAVHQQIPGCYGYNADQYGNDCYPLDIQQHGHNNMGGAGKGCARNGNTKKSCTGDGRYDYWLHEESMAYNPDNSPNGVVCCRSYDPGALYKILTTSGSAMVPSQTVWIAMYFQGLTPLNLFEWQVSMDGNALGYTQKSGELQVMDQTKGYYYYPSFRAAGTSLYQDSTLNNTEVDFVAWKLHLPSTIQAGSTLSLNLNIQYAWNGVYYYNDPYVFKIPVVSPTLNNGLPYSNPPNTFTLSQNLKIGSTGAYSFTFTGISQLRNVKITATDSTGALTFAYPSSRAYSSFNLYDYLEVNSTDYAVIFITATTKATVGRNAFTFLLTYGEGTTTTQTISASVPVIGANNIKREVESRSALDLNLLTTDLGVIPSATGTYVVLAFESSSSASNVRMSFQQQPGFTFHYNEGSQSQISYVSSSSGIQYAHVFVDSPNVTSDTSYNLVLDVSFESSQAETAQFVIPVIVRNYDISIERPTLVVYAGESSYKAIPFASKSGLAIDNVQATSIGSSFYIQLNPATFQDDGGLISASFVAPKETGVYVCGLTISYDVPALSQHFTETVEMTVIVKDKESLEEPVAGEEEHKGNAATVVVIVAASVGTVAGVAVIIASIFVIVFVVRRGRNKISTIETASKGKNAAE